MKKNLAAMLIAFFVLSSFLNFGPSVRAQEQNVEPAAVTDPPNLIPNPTLEADGGGKPRGWEPGYKEGNNITYLYPAEGHEGVGAQIVMDAPGGDGKWNPGIIAVKPDTEYLFTHWFWANVPTRVEVGFIPDNDPEHPKFQIIQNLKPAQNWSFTKTSFKTPVGVSKVYLFHLIDQSLSRYAPGLLAIDDYLLSENRFAEGMVTFTFDDGRPVKKAIDRLNGMGYKASLFYISGLIGIDGRMTEQDMIEATKAGNEMGSHSVTHPFLTQIPTAQMIAEVFGSKSSLEALLQRNGLLATITSFADPFGDFNDATNEQLREAGYLGARTSEPGFNSPAVDDFELRVQAINIHTTPEQVAVWIAEAKEKKLWLILLFHFVQNDVPPGTTTEDLRMTFTDFKLVTKKVAKAKIKVVTVAEGLRMMP